MKDNRTVKELLEVIRDNFLLTQGQYYTDEVLMVKYSRMRKRSLVSLVDFIENRKPALMAKVDAEQTEVLV